VKKLVNALESHKKTVHFAFTFRPSGAEFGAVIVLPFFQRV
jgi:hypothetical protein